jgi:hypothetical protein
MCFTLLSLLFPASLLDFMFLSSRDSTQGTQKLLKWPYEPSLDALKRPFQPFLTHYVNTLFVREKIHSV